MIDWFSSMQQTFEYYMVDPGTWMDIQKIATVKESSITRDNDTDTLGSATIDLTEQIGECYVRIYLIAIQNGETAKVPLGTFLVQTPSDSYDGKVHAISADAYTPLKELKENPMPLGYSLKKGDNILDSAYLLCSENLRAPVIRTKSNKILEVDFVANTDDKYITFVKDLLGNANYELGLDDLGQVLFLPKQDITTLQPVVTFDDGNSSILMPDVTVTKDLYDIPNVVELTYSNGHMTYSTRVVNDSTDSPVSTVNRGRELIYRVINPSLTGSFTKEQIDEYARQVLKSLSTVENTISYTHGYYPVRVGDCVYLDYTKAGIHTKAKVVSQTIKCQLGCPVSEKAVYTENLWR